MKTATEEEIEAILKVVRKNYTNGRITVGNSRRWWAKQSLEVRREFVKAHREGILAEFMRGFFQGQ